jgi:hypothetical protein
LGLESETIRVTYFASSRALVVTGLSAPRVFLQMLGGGAKCGFRFVMFSLIMIACGQHNCLAANFPLAFASSLR